MGNWYYLVSQLPALPQDISAPLPVTEEYFMELCSRFLDGKALKTMQSLSLEPPRSKKSTGSATVDTWYDWERKLRFALGTIRAQRMKKEFSVEDASFPADIMQTARTACGFDSPLEAELFLNGERLKLLESISPSDCFSTDAVFAYALKLKLANRMRKFDAELGMSSYKKIYEKILEGGLA